MNKLLSLVPWWVQALVMAALVGGIALAIHSYGQQRYQAGQAEVQGRWNVEKLQAQAAAIKAQADNAEEAARRTRAQQEAIHERDTKLAAALADADALRAAGQRLRSETAAFIAAHRGGTARDPAIAVGGSTAPDAIDLLADVFGGADDAAGELARALDQSYVAGLTCERIHDSLTNPTPPQ
jgi:hypothetical protein